MTNYGYVRTSTKDQRTTRQVDILIDHGCAALFIDAGVSGRVAPSARPQFSAALRQMTAGDNLIVTDLARLGRNVRDIFLLVDDLTARGMSLRSLHEDIDTSPGNDRNTQLIAFFGIFAELERQLISERTLEGLAAARSRGRFGGRPIVVTDEVYRRAQQLIDTGSSITDAATIVGVSRASLYRAFDRHKTVAA